MTKTDQTAIAIALDELDSYIGVIGEDALAEMEQNPAKLEWASKKLHALLEREAGRGGSQ